MSKIRAWPFPGKVLFIDNRYDEVDLAISQLLTKGVPVEYWDSKAKREFRNIRVVLLDIALKDGISDLVTGSSKFNDAINALGVVGGCPLVLILSHSDSEPEELKKAIKASRKEYAGFISTHRLKKDELDDPEELIKEVAKGLSEEPQAQLAMTWEALVDMAKDKAVASITGSNTATVKTLLRILRSEVGEDGLSRQFVDTVMRILSRHAHEGAEFDALSKILEGITREKVDLTKETSNEVLSLLLYSDPSKESWTGDIYYNSKGSPMNYALVLTPACDFAQRQPSSVLVAFGFSMDGCIDNRKTILYQRHHHLKALLLEMERGDNDAKKAKARLVNLEGKLKEGKSFSENLCPMWHIKQDGKFVSVCFDFEDLMVKPVDKIKEERWSKIARLDSPFIEALLQDFGEHLSRIGVPTVNLPLQSLGDIAGTLKN